MMIGQIISTGFGHSLQLMVWQIIPEIIPRCFQRVVEDIIRVIHLICPECSLEASFVESGIMRYQWKALDAWCNLFPDIRKYRSLVRISLRQSVNSLAAPVVIVRLRLNQGVESFDEFATTHDNNAHRAYAGRVRIGSLKVECSERVHSDSIDY